MQVGNGFDVAPGKDEEMHRRLRIDIVEHGDVVVPVDGLRVRVADQATEDAVRHTISSNCPARLPRAGAVACR